MGTCDWAQILFSGGYKVLILVIILNIVVLWGKVKTEIKAYYDYTFTGKESVKKSAKVIFKLVW